MIIKVRTLQGLQKEVDVATGETIKGLKKKVEEALPEMESSKQKIIFGGKILEDTTIVSDTLRENDAVIVMVNRKNTFKNADAKENEKEKENGNASTNDVSNTASNSTTGKAATDAMTANTAETDSQHKENIADESLMLTGDALLTTINNICNMGFEREQVERAMNAAYNNPSRAVDYLTNGFPDNNAVEENANVNADANTNADVDANENAEEYEDDEEYEEDQEEGNDDSLEDMGGDNVLPTGDVLDFATDEQTRQFLNNPNFINIIRNVAMGNPQRISEMLELIGRTDPELLHYIRDNQSQITYIMQQLINSHGGNADGVGSSDESFTMENYEELHDQLSDILMDQRPNRENVEEQEENALFTPTTIALTEKELESVKKLEALGFPKHVALEAFIACDKNEELAANYLFENMDQEGAS